MLRLVPTCVYRVDARLLELLEVRLGLPTDAYYMGWQVWLEHNGPGGERLEWRLHPPAGYRPVRGLDHNELFEAVLGAVAAVDDPDADALDVAGERRPLSGFWEVLEVFPADGDDLEPGALAAAVTDALGGRAPDGSGRVDHGRLGDVYRARRGDYSVGDALLAEVVDG